MRDTVMIVGSGVMGSAIGAMAALAGHKTVLADVNLKKAENGLKNAISCIISRVENGLAEKEEGERAIKNITVTDDVAEEAERAFLVIEAIIEKLETKQIVFTQLDKLLPPDVPICSNTSGLRITEIAAMCKYPERTLTTHFWLPAHLVPLVEVVMGDKSSLKIAESIVAELKRWKKSPVLVRCDLPGQLANRIFQAVIREAVSIVASGLASAEDVDTAIGCGMALRFPVWGPLMHLDAVGLDLGLSVQDSVLPSINNQKEAHEYLRRLIADGNTGAIAGMGFYDWKRRSICEATEKRNKYIIESVKILNELNS